VFYQTLLIRIFSDSLLILQWINALITASICVIIYDIGRMFHRDAALLAGLCYAVYPSSIVMTQVLTNQHIAALLFYAVFWIILRKLSLPLAVKLKGFWRNPGTRTLFWTLLAGLLFGLAHSMRGIGLPLLLAVALYWFCVLPWRQVLLRGAIFVLGFMLISNGFYFAAWQKGILDDPGRRADLRYKILVGFNHDSSGLYNAEDAENFFGTAEGEARDRYFRETMEERLSDPPSVLYLLGSKIYRMWGVTDSAL
jgi:4-amino-4-deoxy-L-arabinose transferase-like glycosyltransferase